MTEYSMILIAVVGFCYALFARRLEQGVVTPPMVAIALGLLLGLFLTGDTEHVGHTLHVVAEITLVIVLFSDAAMVKARVLRAEYRLPLRMLAIGLPLAMLFGFVVNLLFLPDWPVWELALLAAILAPTDAALGQAVVTNTKVPERLRNALTVESGANDGLALPAILFFGCLAVSGVHDNIQTSWVVFTLEQIGFGIIVGVVIGGLGAVFMSQALVRGYTNELFEGVAVLALAALCYLASGAIGGNGFLSTFIGGLTFGMIFENRCKFVLEFLETEGQLLVLGTFVLLGFVVGPGLVETLHPLWALLILVSLFVTRPLAIWLSLLGSKTTTNERLFLGWFGPRGLATALFALLILQEFEGLQHGHEILQICFLAVVISATLHGVSASPIAGRFGKAAPTDPSKSASPKV